MSHAKIQPFVEGPVREKQVLSLGFFRTGSHSLKEALTILGYRDTFHTSVIARSPEKWPTLEAAADDNIPSLTTYTGKTWSRQDWDTLFGPCEALTDVTPWAYDLLQAYPDAKVILVKRDFESWKNSFLKTLLLPSSATTLSQLSGRVCEPFLGIRISQSAWKAYMGIFGVSKLDKLTDERVLRAGYERHYNIVKKLVPPEQLLELDLKDLDWEPLCKFLGKDTPDVAFPRLNESRVFQDVFRDLHKIAITGSLVKVVSSAAAVGGLVSLIWWVTRIAKTRGVFERLWSWMRMTLFRS